MFKADVIKSVTIRSASHTYVTVNFNSLEFFPGDSSECMERFQKKDILEKPAKLR